MSVILGLNAYHPDSAACVLVDGVVKSAIAEERLGKRVKHIACFPSLAIQKALELANVTIKDVDWVAIGHNSNANFGSKIRRVLSNPFRSIRGIKANLQRRKAISTFREQIASECGFALDDCRFQFFSVEHHLAHMASSFFASPFEEAAGFTYDGSGDFVSGMYAQCRDNRISILDRVYLPHSLGHFYTGICQLAGFDRFGEEYKVMGLSAFGKPVFMDLMKKILSFSGNQYRINSNFIQAIGIKPIEECVDEKGEIIIPPMYEKRLIQELGEPRKRGTEFTQRDNDLAASMQLHFEEIVLKCLEWLHQQVPVENLISAGGCALNGVCNSRILRDTPFKKSYIQCAASDDGTAIGAALYVWHEILKKPRGFVMEQAYYGSESTDAEIETALKNTKLPYEKLERQPLIDRVSQYLNTGQIVGWFQGRSEWGPRALGNRSLLAHPGWPGMKELINQKIKRRESFRPFAPSILAEEVPNYFEQTVESPFMMHVVKIRPEKRQALSAVCHEDFTGRLHTVKQSQNALYYDLIKTFGQLSGTPVVLNTSFNENEPIVETPEQAIACYLRNDVDALCMGSYVTSKQLGKPSKSPSN
jgi:carbamoyltransferase